MKKILTLAAVAAFASLSACKKEEAPVETPTAEATQASEAPPIELPAEESSEAK